MLQPVIDSGNYNGTQYAAPQSSDGGMLYYRTDLVKTPPKSWDEMMGMCSIATKNKIDCYAGQFAKYEGLTVNASEAINGAGGQIVDAAGKATVDSPSPWRALDTLVQAYADGKSRRQRSHSRKRRAASPSRTASSCSCASGPTPTA